MTQINLTTLISAPIETVFDMSRSVELHIISTQHTDETIVSDRTSSLFVAGDNVTWRAKHFGIYHAVDRSDHLLQLPFYFEDKMVKGAFKFFTHKLYFETNHDLTVMRDQSKFVAPLKIVGTFASFLSLKSYMTKLLYKWNETINCFQSLRNADPYLRRMITAYLDS